MEIVSFEIAQKLKEKGYPQDITKHNAWYATEYYKNSCLGEYFEGELTPIGEYGDKINALHIIEVESKGVVAPTISQVLKWLRDEKQIHIYTDIVSAGWVYNVLINVKKFEDDTWWYNGVKEEGYYDSYEQAALAGIEYVLDNLI